MLLVIDVGNTNIVLGIFKGKELMDHWRVSTDRLRTTDEYGVLIRNLFYLNGVNSDEIDAIIISSVVPPVMPTLERMCQRYFGLTPLVIGPGVKTGMDIKYDNPREVGADRIVNAVAAYEKFGGPVIIIDFGTATTYGVISAKNEFMGGAIGPGLRMMNAALAGGTAKLPSIELVMPPTVIGRTTVTNIQSGILYGYMGSVEKIVNEMRREMGCPQAKVIATGGMAHMVKANSCVIDEIDPDLTLNGLRLIYEKNEG